MGKALLAGLWVFAVTLASIYFGRPVPPGSEATTHKASPVEFIKLKPITVPVVSSGLIEGYVLAVIGCNVDLTKLAERPAALDAMMQDEAFRTLYGVESTKYKKPRKSDLAEVSKDLKDNLNKRLTAEFVVDVLIEELSYIPKEKARSGRGM